MILQTVQLAKRRGRRTPRREGRHRATRAGSTGCAVRTNRHGYLAFRLRFDARQSQEGAALRDPHEHRERVEDRARGLIERSATGFSTTCDARLDVLVSVPAPRPPAFVFALCDRCAGAHLPPAATRSRCGSSRSKRTRRPPSRGRDGSDRQTVQIGLTALVVACSGVLVRMSGGASRACDPPARRGGDRAGR